MGKDKRDKPVERPVLTEEQKAALVETPPLTITEARRITLEKMVDDLVKKQVDAAKKKVLVLSTALWTVLGVVGGGATYWLSSQIEVAKQGVTTVVNSVATTQVTAVVRDQIDPAMRRLTETEGRLSASRIQTDVDAAVGQAIGGQMFKIGQTTGELSNQIKSYRSFMDSVVKLTDPAVMKRAEAAANIIKAASGGGGEKFQEAIERLGSQDIVTKVNLLVEDQPKLLARIVELEGVIAAMKTQITTGAITVQSPSVAETTKISPGGVIVQKDTNRALLLIQAGEGVVGVDTANDKRLMYVGKTNNHGVVTPN